MFSALLPGANASGVARPPAGARPLPRTALAAPAFARPAAPSLIAAAAPAGAPSSTGGSGTGTAPPASSSSSASKPAAPASGNASAPSTSSAAAAADALVAARGSGRGGGGGSGRALRAGEVVATSSALATSISYRVRPGGGGGAGGGGAAAQKGGVQDFLDKLYLAWRVFFPERPPDLTPKDGAKQRLRMILVADRCGLSPSGLADMKRNILRALEDFVDIESEEEIDISISLEPDLGTIYCVAVPVKRVKPGARLGPDGLAGGDEALLEWDPEDKDCSPASRFPMGC